jgi:hypothetical protein
MKRKRYTAEKIIAGASYSHPAVVDGLRLRSTG